MASIAQHLLTATGWRLLLVLAGLSFAAPALAAPDPCSGLPDQLRAEDAGWLSYDLKQRFTMREAKLIAGLTVAEGTDRDQIGPQYEAATKRIIVPPGFLRSHCHMILLQMMYNDAPGPGFADIGKRMRDCIAAGSKRLPCLDETIAQFVKSQPTAQVQTLTSNAGALLMLTVFAVQFELAHEAGHVIMQATRSAAALRQVDVELEADIMAEAAIVGETPFVGSPVYILASASLIETEANPLYEPALCRLRRTRAVLKQVALPAVLVRSTLIPNTTADGIKRVVQFSAASLGQPLLTGPEVATCAAGSDQRLTQATADMTDLLAAIGVDGAGNAVSSPDAATMFARLTAFAPRTSAGVRLRSMLRLASATRASNIQAIMANVQSGNVDQQSLRQFVAKLAILGQVVRNIDDMSPSEGAMLLLVHGWARFLAQPPGSSLSGNLQQLRKDLASLETVDPVAGDVDAAIYALKLFPDLPNLWTDGLVHRVSVEIIVNILIGDCEGASRLADQVGRLMPAAGGNQITVDACRSARPSMLATWATSLSWKNDIR